MASTTDTFLRPPPGTPKTDSRMLFLRSYLTIRTAVGVLGILLPLLLALGDWFFVARGITAKGLPPTPPTMSAWDLLHLRGSISAYYHTNVGDLFVAGLAVIGLLLILYMAGQWAQWDCKLSLGAGVALLGVVFFPTSRPDKLIPADANVPAIACGALPNPTDCSPIQSLLGEARTAGIHFTFAVVFIVLLAALSIVFGRRMYKYEPKRPSRHVHYICAGMIVLALIWVYIGYLLKYDIFGLTPLYVGEVVSVWAFATSWLFKGLSIGLLLTKSRKSRSVSSRSRS